jgi:subtilisin family serine protease
MHSGSFRRGSGLRAAGLAGLVALLAMVALAPRAHAQLPRVQLPNVPGVELPGPATGAVGRVENTVGTVAGQVEQLADVRRLRVNELLRTQRANLERDPAGQPILRAELVSFDPTDAALDRARAAGFQVVRERVLEGLDSRVVVLRAPEGMTTRRALRRLRALDPQGAYDYNHVYLDSGVIAPTIAASDAPVFAPGGVPSVSTKGAAANRPKQSASGMLRLAALAPDASDAAGAPTAGRFKVGLVDGGVDVSHPVFKATAVHQYGCDGKSIPTAHGTAVASLLVGKADPFTGAAPGAELFAADVYCGLGTGGAADAVVDAIAWIARQHVAVINVSLVGPKNVLLENVVRLVIARGHIIVAAVGNDGPAAPPLYPASYPDVVGVTAVDAHRKVLIEACRGKQVKFAAPGADMAAAELSPTFAVVRGTSFAAPIVAGLLAASLHEPDREAAKAAIQTLAGQAIDLGSRGVDKTYGAGLVGDFVRSQAALALVSASGGSRGH